MSTNKKIPWKEFEFLTTCVRFGGLHNPPNMGRAAAKRLWEAGYLVLVDSSYGKYKATPKAVKEVEAFALGLFRAENITENHNHSTAGEFASGYYV